VEDELMKPKALSALLLCFVNAKAVSFENLLDPFLKMLRLSSTVATGLTKSSAFFKRLVDRLEHSTKAVIRLNLLRILRTVIEVHPNRVMLVEKYGLLNVVEGLSKGGGAGAVLVRELARDILPSLKPVLRPLGSESASPRSAIAPKKMMRRSASEATATTVGTRTSRGGGEGGPSLPRHRLGDIQWSSTGGDGHL